MSWPLAFRKDPGRKPAPFVMVYDFVGMDAMTRSPAERFGAFLWNWKWSGLGKNRTDVVDLALFVGEAEDVPDRPFGPFLPNRRTWAEAVCRFVGYILPFDPAELQDRSALRRRLGYDDSPLVVCSIGGTAIGKGLLELCGRAYALAASQAPGLRMILVCGPRLAPESLDVPEGVEVRGYVPGLHEHLAASDLAVVQGGGTVTLELTALRRPFLFFPIEGHSEQEVHVAGRLARHGSGVRMVRSDTTPESLAKAVIQHLGSEAAFPPIPVDGARVAAGLISALL